MRSVRDAPACCTIEIESEREREKAILAYLPRCHGEAIQHSRTTFSRGYENSNGLGLLMDNLLAPISGSTCLHASGQVLCLWLNNVIAGQM